MTSAVHDDAASSACETAASTGSRTRKVVPRGPLDSMVRAPAVPLGNPFRNRQAQPRALAAARRIQLHEAIEDSRAILVGDAGAAVGDADADLRAVDRDVNCHRAAGRRVLDAFWSRLTTSRRSSSVSARTGTSDAPVTCSATCRSAAIEATAHQALVDRVVEVEINRPERKAAGVGARQHEHVFDQACPDGATGRAAMVSRVSIFRSRMRALAAERYIRGERMIETGRPELMGGVGHELPLGLQRARAASDADR